MLKFYHIGSFRTSYAPYSVFFVQIASNYVGIWLAKVIPAKYIQFPFTSYGFDLNPGPWNSKEHVLVTISAASGIDLSGLRCYLTNDYRCHLQPRLCSNFYCRALLWRCHPSRYRDFLHVVCSLYWLLVRCTSKTVFALRSAISLVSGVSDKGAPRELWVSVNHKSDSAKQPFSKPKRRTVRLPRQSPESRWKFSLVSYSESLCGNSYLNTYFQC